MPKGMIGQAWNYQGTMDDLRALKLGEYTRENCPKTPLVSLKMQSENGTEIEVSIYTNYWCDGPYGPDQPMTLCGFSLYAYRGGEQKANKSVDAADEIDLVLPDLVEEAAAACQHKGSRELKMPECRDRRIYHAGNCFHVLECPTCGEVYSYDSSG